MIYELNSHITDENIIIHTPSELMYIIYIYIYIYIYLINMGHLLFLSRQTKQTFTISLYVFGK